MRRFAFWLFIVLSCVPSCTKMEKDEDVVDLGLSVKWAKCNLGAIAPEFYGNFFSWGETEPKMDFNSDYKYEPTLGHLIKYCNDPAKGDVDNLVRLERGDDAASAKLGGKWRIPTIEEWKELLENCRWIWTDGYKNSWVPGYIIISKIPGYENNELFLPAVGYVKNAHLGDREIGYYWTSDLFEEDCYNAMSLKIFEEDKEFWGMPRNGNGFQIRAVKEKK